MASLFDFCKKQSFFTKILGNKGVGRTKTRRKGSLVKEITTMSTWTEVAGSDISVGQLEEGGSGCSLLISKLATTVLGVLD